MVYLPPYISSDQNSLCFIVNSFLNAPVICTHIPLGLGNNGDIDFYPHSFLKKRQVYCNRLRPSVTLSPKPLDEIQSKGYFHLCPRMDFLQTLHINNSLHTNYENVFIELDS